MTHCGTKTLHTENLILRKFKYEDDQDMLKNWASDERVQLQYAEPVYKTKSDVKTLLNKYISSYEKLDYYRWAIILKENSECIGQIAFYFIDNKNEFAEIEYCIGHDFQCNGYATEATRKIMQFGFKEINFFKVQIGHKSINLPSKKVIEKCKFKFDGKIRACLYPDGRFDRFIYSLLNSEYEQINKIS